MTGKQLISLMRRHAVTIRELKARTGITLQRIRQVCKSGLTEPNAVRDWVQAITGTDPGPIRFDDFSGVTPMTYSVKATVSQEVADFMGLSEIPGLLEIVRPLPAKRFTRADLPCPGNLPDDAPVTVSDLALDKKNMIAWLNYDGAPPTVQVRTSKPSTARHGYGSYAWETRAVIDAETLEIWWKELRNDLESEFSKSPHNHHKPQTHTQFLAWCLSSIGIKGGTVADRVQRAKASRPDIYCDASPPLPVPQQWTPKPRFDEMIANLAAEEARVDAHFAAHAVRAVAPAPAVAMHVALMAETNRQSTATMTKPAA